MDFFKWSFGVYASSPGFALPQCIRNRVAHLNYLVYWKERTFPQNWRSA